MKEKILKFNQLIKRELSQIILREVEFPANVLVTLTRVETTTNLNEAKVFISSLPESKQEEVLKTLNYQIWHLQQLLNKRLRTRPIPKIIFLKEKETIKASKIEEILNKLKKKEK